MTTRHSVALAEPTGQGLAVELAPATLERLGGPPVAPPDVAQLATERIARTLGRYDFNLTSERLFVLASPACKRRLMELATHILSDLDAHGLAVVTR